MSFPDSAAFVHIAPEIIELFERAIAHKEGLRATINTLANKPHRSVREMLMLALFRNELNFLEPQSLPDDVRPGAALWRHWVNHPDELRKYNALRDEISSYLNSAEQSKGQGERNKEQMVSLIAQDALTLLALHPIAEELSAPAKGRPVTQRAIATEALELKIHKQWTWKRITAEVCDCPKPEHDNCCQENIRHGVMALKTLLRECGINDLTARY